jgi:hypothetical protein
MATMTVSLAGGRWTYVDDARKRPHVHPLRSPGGVTLTRDTPDDHPWHHALWFTIKYVNEENFWEEQAPYGVLRHVDEVAVDERSVRGTLHWIRPDRETVAMVEQRSLTHVDIDGDAYAIDWTTVLTPATDVLLDRTPFTTWGGYGGLALRGRNDWTDTRFLIDGLGVTDRVTGHRGRWCDLSGSVDGQSAGVVFLDAPSNPRHPVAWYGSTRAATYGDDGWSNFVNAAFLWDEPLAVARGEDLSFSYRVVVHNGEWDDEQCARAWRSWSEAHG